ncbi:probable palmitoyltransferase ZDHHC24 [Haliotis rufescens]|uniref:probable palmitoyltransferase ZDHHC24 n=1 Tax=Haliotis rufescens TaxID=6454 RepID=UPI00201EE42D|nr:probable palmitoyltransferase ZDHHC24 [Haliotis rufescens]
MARRWKLPNRRGDQIALAVFTFGGVFALWYEVFHVLPTFYPEWTTESYVHCVLAAVLASNIYGNMFMLATTDVSGTDLVMPTGPAPKGWRYCDTCVSNYPPRSHHCKLCNICVLKRDHHCFFSGYCIGYHNYRYYVVMVTYMMLAGIYGNIFNLSFVLEAKGGISFWRLVSFCAPHVGFMFGFESLYVSFITSVTSVGFLVTYCFAWLFLNQVIQIYKGQTMHERKKQISTYNLGLKHNIVEALGKNWCLVWFAPWIPSKLPGDGLSFRSQNTKEL